MYQIKYEFEPSDRVRIRFLDNKLDSYSPDGVLTRHQNHGIAADGPAVAENFDHVVSRLRRWFWAHRHVYRATGIDSVQDLSAMDASHNFSEDKINQI